MGRTVVGITANIFNDRNDFYWDIQKTYIVSEYAEAVKKAGGIPIIIPVCTEDEILKAQVELVDGIIITGGIDANPLLFNEEPIKDQGLMSDELDEFDIKVIKISKEMKKPILGICRGLQMINVAFGGTLYQDLSQLESYYVLHKQKAQTWSGTHTVNISEDSILHSILGSKTLVNSFHHQAVKDVAPGFKITAYSQDGVIEAMESEEGFILGVQWHPEWMAPKHPHMLKIFEKFIAECKK